ncbi:MAG: PQQ-like beta-propeller repeat protein [Chlorobi bacterium]|nr:PQQ-like beta-propeller repeat protein [Chlorobiota bacterium]
MMRTIALLISLISLVLNEPDAFGQWCSGLLIPDRSVFNDGTYNGDIIVGVGYSNEVDSLGKWAHIAAFDTSGQVLWQRRFKMLPLGSIEDNYFTTATALPNGDFLAAMGTGTIGSAITSLFVFNQNGDTTFFKTYNIFPDEEYFNIAKVLRDGTVLVGGMGNDDVLYYGTLLWFAPNTYSLKRVVGYYFLYHTYAPIITDFVELNGKIYFVAYIMGTNKSLVMCVDTTGNIIWKKVLVSDNTLMFQLEGITIASDGNLYVTGYRSGQNIYGSYGIVALAMDTSGNLLWYQQYVSPSMPYISGKGLDIYHVPLDNSLFISGSQNETKQLFLKIDLSGQIIWSKSFSYSGEILRIFPGNNGFYLIGSTEMVNQGSVYKVDYMGNSCCTAQSPTLLQAENFPLAIVDTYIIGRVFVSTLAPFPGYPEEVSDQGQQDLCEPLKTQRVLNNKGDCEIIQHSTEIVLNCKESIDEVKIITTNGRFVWRSTPNSKKTYLPALPRNLLIIKANLKNRVWTGKLLIY